MAGFTKYLEVTEKDMKQAKQIASNLAKIIKEVSSRAGKKEANVKCLLTATNNENGR